MWFKLQKLGKLNLDYFRCKSWNCKRHITWLWLCNFRALHCKVQL